MSEKVKTNFIRLLILVGLLLSIEAVMWLMDYRPGVMDDRLFPVSEFSEEAAFKSDEFGISSYVAGGSIIPHEYVLNKQGFRSSFDYTKPVIDSLRQQSNKRIIFLIGDSYAQGCCDSPIDSSFSDLLAKNSSHHVLNFGIGAVDLYQYQQIVKKYVPLLNPDLVVIAFYLGNDISYHKRAIAPGIPFCYVIRDYPWLNSKIPVHYEVELGKEYFNSAEEAYSFYLNKYTLWGTHSNSFEKIIRNSILLSKPYLNYKQKNENERLNERKKEYYTVDSDSVNTVQALKEIQAICTQNHTSLLIAGIPSPLDADSQKDLNKTYQKYFEPAKVAYAFPDISEYSIHDYDGPETQNHFLNSGHLKFYSFLNESIHTQLKTNPY